MLQIINALDNLTSKQTGENGQDEYEWSNNVKERILQLNFQLTRTDTSNVCNLHK